MAKRFTESDKWLDPWFAELDPSFKLAWLYLLDRCDAAGVIDLSARIAASLIGDATDWEAFIDASDGRVTKLECGKLWLTGFCAYQYGDLKSDYNPHKAAVRSVEKYSLPVAVDGVLIQPTPKLAASLPQGCMQPSGMDKGKDQEKVKGGSGGKTRPRFKPPTVEEVAAYCDERRNGIDAEAFVAHYDAVNWKRGKGVAITDWKACVRTWEARRRDETRGSPQKPPPRTVTDADLLAILTADDP